MPHQPIDRRPPTGDGPIVQLVVRRVAGPHARYRLPEDDRSLRLVAVEAGEDACATIADVAALRGRRGAPPVLVVSSVQLTENASFDGRLLGGFVTADWLTLVATPVQDSAFSSIADIEGLPPILQTRLAAASGMQGVTSPRVLSAAAAGEHVTSLVRAARTLSPALPDRPAFGAAWLVEPAQLAATKGGPHTEAERMLPLLPWRFQRYVAGSLLADERILLFLQRPAFSRRYGPMGLRRTQYLDGLMVITDRMVFMMQDAVPPGISKAHWGYKAEASGIERVNGVAVLRDDKAVNLELALAGDQGGGSLTWPFSAGQEAEVQMAARLLETFVATPTSRALRRRYGETERWSPAGAQASADGLAVGSEEALQEAERLGSVEAAARVSLRGPDGQIEVGEEGVTVTLAQGQARIVPIGDLTWAGMTLSLLGCRVVLGLGGGAPPLPLRFPYNEAGDVLSAFTKLRHQLGRAF